jgi:hypothetical protein
MRQCEEQLKRVVDSPMTDQALRRKQRLAAALRENLKRRKAQQRVRTVQDMTEHNPSATDTATQDTPDTQQKAPQQTPQNDAERIPAPAQPSGR